MSEEMKVTYHQGPAIIIGDYEIAGVVIQLRDPWGNIYQTPSGHKPEHGKGGFEFLAPNPGTPYTLVVGGASYEFGHKNGVTNLSFPGTGSIPVEPAPPPDPIQVIPDPEEDPEVRYQEVMDKLDRIIEMLEERCG